MAGNSNGTNGAGTADLKFLQRSLRVHCQELQIESGTGINTLPISFGFRRSL